MTDRIHAPTLLALVLTLCATSADAQPAADPVPKAEQLMADAMTRYEAADLGGALELLAQAYALEPRPDILFAMGRIHVERGECVEAIDAYRRFLTSKPGPNSTQIATDAIADCQRILAASGTPVPDPPPDADGDAGGDDTKPPAREDHGPPPPTTRTRVRPWYTDTLGDGLVLGGTAAGVAAGLLYLSARSDVSRADEGGPGGVSLAEHDRLTERAETKQLWAGVAGAAGAALIIGGVVRYVTGDRTETITVAPAATAGGGSVTLGWRF
ncbi:MAG: hypothetical protein K8M05_32975 [Deltaproteobacteria bacterium]|nr:hypothetical protein [Kofleriaceae bacterium]